MSCVATALLPAQNTRHDLSGLRATTAGAVQLLDET